MRISVIIICTLVLIGREPLGAQDRLALFNEICDTVAANFYSAEKITTVFEPARPNWQKKISTVSSQKEFAQLVNGLLATLKTSHTNYFTINDPAYYQIASIFHRIPQIRQLFGDEEILYPSIGVLTGKIDDSIFVRSVLSGGPADSAGVLLGDQILAVNGKPYDGISSFAELVNRNVALQLQRTPNKPPITIQVIPKLVNPSQEFLDAQYASVRIIERDRRKLGYIHIWSYAGQDYQTAFEAAISFGALKDADALIWDLRDGWGGASPAYLNVFNRKVPVYTRLDRDGKEFHWDSQWRKPVVMLVNEGVRSGKEILAYGFRKHQLGTIVGERTAGAVTAGRLFVLSDKSILYLAVSAAKIDGEILEGKGVKPDIEVEMDIRYLAGQDRQLEEAISTLLDML